MCCGDGSSSLYRASFMVKLEKIGMWILNSVEKMSCTYVVIAWIMFRTDDIRTERVNDEIII